MPTRTLDLILASLALLGPFAIHLFFPVIPVVKLDFELSDALAQLTFSLGVFGMAFSTLVYGTYADRYGRRPVLLIGLLFFFVGSIISALAGSLTSLLVGRLVQSIGAGCGITLARAIARDVYGAEHLVKAIAYLTMFFALGGLLAPGVGGLLIDHLGWRSVFYFAGLIGFVIALSAYFVVPETGVRMKANSGSPMVASFLELLRQPRFCALVIHTGCSTGTFLIVATASSTLMKELLHRPATEFGLYFAMVPLGFIIGTIISSRVGKSCIRRTHDHHRSIHRADRRIRTIGVVVIRTCESACALFAGLIHNDGTRHFASICAGRCDGSSPQTRWDCGWHRRFRSKLLRCRICADLRPYRRW